MGGKLSGTELPGSWSEVPEILIRMIRIISLIRVHIPDMSQLPVRTPENNYQNRTRTTH